jgi:hypothetical protein
MLNAKQTLEATQLQMRWRALSLAADLDRLERAAGGADLLRNDLSIARLRRALRVLLEDSGNRAEQVQMIFSDHSPLPPRPSK